MTRPCRECEETMAGSDPGWPFTYLPTDGDRPVLDGGRNRAIEAAFTAVLAGIEVACTVVPVMRRSS